ncbi:HlyD family secretion protein [Helcococcus massiliensis]|uniref:HlyD family secretion protein n=1 Tax=Helcococcus massiliensis TaxID=2040290 RepID=UPI000CDF0E71|nr:HlyD family efflux transporter periplasmic adaptor subunit [Helcococcus massiliensis]
MKLYNKEKLKNSRIFFDKKPAKFMTILIYFALFLLILFVFISSKVRKTYIVRANGQVSDKDISYVSSNINGTVKKIIAKEGDWVKEGTLILGISNGEENTQRKEYEKVLDKNIEKRKLLDRYRKSLDENKNHLKDLGTEQEYYGKVEYYLQAMETEKKNQAFTIQDIKKKENKINEKTFEKDYLSNKLKKLARNNDIHKESDLEAQYQEYKTNIESLESEIQSLKEEIAQLERQNSNSPSQSKQIYFQFINEIGNDLKNIEKIDAEIKMNISVLEKRDQNYEILAPKSGYIHYINPIKEGVNIQINQTLAEISELKENNYHIEALINLFDISKVKIGQDVDLSLIGVNEYKYGTLKGKIKSIENGLVTTQSQEGNSSFYKATIEVKDKKLKKGGDEISLLISMPVEARIIYDKESYLDYFLEKLRFKSK